MKVRIALLSLVAVLILAACGQKALKESITLVNQDNEEVTFPTDKPVLFFFITGYT